MKTDEWNSCYPSNWKGLIVSDAVTHPAKYSSRLIRRIYEHLQEEGWIKQGDCVVDPFGGVALGAFDAMCLGLRWCGCELEPRFVEIGNANIALWNRTYSRMPHWGSAELLQGDSRKLAEILSGGDICVTSPPYAGMEIEKNSPSINLEKLYEGYKRSGGGQSYEAFCRTQLKHSVGYSSAVSSPPYADARIAQEGGANGDNMRRSSDKGRYSAVVSSPPYADSVNSKDNGIDLTKIRGKDKHVGVNSQVHQEMAYGTQNGQLGAMKSRDESFQAAIGSPPFQGNGGGTRATGAEGTPLGDQKLFKRHAASSVDVGYAEQTDGNLGNVIGDDFWLSARVIVEQVYQVLVPGAHAVWVVKDYVKGGKRVPFSEQWRQMCEAVGFTTLHEHHAMLVKHSGKSLTLEGEVVEHKTEHKSFFRRLAEKKGSPKIDYEVVYCMTK